MKGSSFCVLNYPGCRCKSLQIQKQITFWLKRMQISTLLLATVSSLCLISSPLAYAVNDPCTGGSQKSCAGNQADGIVESSPPTDELNVNNLSTAITPDPGKAGIDYTSTNGNNLNLKSGSGEPQAEQIIINTSGDGAKGIVTNSTGQPGQVQPVDAFFGIEIPGDPAVAGGVVDVESYSDITTTGGNANGIFAQSNTTGYPSSVIQGLETFSSEAFVDKLSVESVINPDDASTDNVGQTVLGQRIDEDGNPVTGNGGSFAITRDGAPAFVPGTDFDALSVGEFVRTQVSYTIRGENTDSGDDKSGRLIVLVTQTESGPAWQYLGAEYPTLPGSTKQPPDDQAPMNLPSIFPDVGNYIDGLLADANAGGLGNSVTVFSHGTIKTTSNNSTGIVGQSLGGPGSGGEGAGIFESGTNAGSGSASSTVEVTNNGNIETKGQASHGILSLSRGGNGGRGGDSFCCNASSGGTGGDSGAVRIRGAGIIETIEESSFGLFALSKAGNGGNGGDSDLGGAGGKGAGGGRGDIVLIEGDWTITTHGNKSHGISANSLGGTGGTGGDNGAIPFGGGPGSGGDSGFAGVVTVNTHSTIKTSGLESHGIFAQSVGGQAGDGGDAAGLISFAANGGSAGDGGAVTIKNCSLNNDDSCTSDSVNLKSITTEGVNSNAIFAESVGGGGGSGGNSFGLFYSDAGAGSAGGNGSSVWVENSAKLTTQGANSRGIFAQSIGGGGGNGGNSVGIVSMGGRGSATSDGGTVTVKNSGDIATTAVNNSGAVADGDKQCETGCAQAIFAQSVGGGGGNGGSSGGWFSVGGRAGGGGDSAQVEVENYGNLETAGIDSSAIFAQSVGGGGGNGGGSFGAGLFASSSIGGEGGKGGDSQKVEVESFAGDITTQGDRSFGIFAQSLGGGGGNGGLTGSISVGVGVSVSVSVGGAAGGGGDAKEVVLVNHSKITTQGDDANGIFAESLGGGGGNGGFAFSLAVANGLGVAFSYGGAGGDGGDGKNVDVDNFGSIETTGKRSIGLQAQSVGGGGGNGGSSLSLSGGTAGAVSISIGGTAGGGGSAESVDVLNKGGIKTKQQDAYGLLAQSVGGGGGNGGFSIALAGAGTGAASGSVGGEGGQGGKGNTVTVNSYGKIETEGVRAVGLFAQSVGGGGGNGGFSISGAGAGTGAGTLSVGGSGEGGGNADTVTVNNFGAVTTLKEDAYGLLAQSVGGGGGNGGFSITASGAKTGAASIGIGGFADKGGEGRTVTVINDGVIDTTGDRAAGLFAQSVGGGGGTGGFSVAASGAKTGSGTFSLGGGGGPGGNGALVDVANKKRIVTKGELAYGIIAQSVGGGGGAGGFSFAAGVATDGGSLEATIGGFGGVGGDGGEVKLTNEEEARVDTREYGAHALVAQSVGGGGGTGGLSGSLTVAFGDNKPSASLSMGGFGDAAGNGKRVELSNKADLGTAGVAAYGIFAQSIGGGGGDGGGSFALNLGQHEGGTNIATSLGGKGEGGGTAELVDVDNWGDITTTGNKAHGIVVQSVGGGGGNGGFSVTGVFDKGTKTNDLAVNVGGFAGAGGDAGVVDVHNDGNILTPGVNSGGIIAQSLGGGGGNGGLSFAGSFTGSQTKNLAVSIGGFAASAGKGKAVTVTNSGRIETGPKVINEPAPRATATLHRSIAVTLPDPPPPPPELPKHPEAELIENTEKFAAHGIIAQSIGGNGGRGGQSISVGTGFGGEKDTWNVNSTVAVGGFGGTGDSAGATRIVNKASIITNAYDSHGLFAQSVGGSGGEGGSSYSATVTTGAGNVGRTYNGSISVGGKGGEGNTGDGVEVDNSGAIETFKDKSHGILAQSIGGGGGSGGDARGINLLLDVGNEALTADQTAGKNWKLSVTVGGSAGDGNRGGPVTVNNCVLMGDDCQKTAGGGGNITTHGEHSDGIFAQSIGGGGGAGGNGIQGLGTEKPVVDGAFALGSFGLESQGGGGNFVKRKLSGYFRDLSASAGGDAGVNGHAEEVTVNSMGEIVTDGYGSVGIRGQSVGGGGGIAQNFAKVEDNGGKAVGGFTTKFTLGGKGGADREEDKTAGNGGTVTVKHTGNITTSGDDAAGVFAQSVGGGGGVAGNVDRTLPNVVNFGAGVGFGQEGGGAGDGGAVTVTTTGDILTIGKSKSENTDATEELKKGAHGIKAQSIGGGGGSGGGLAVIEGAITNVVFDGTTGGAGSGGKVTVTHTGKITTQGDEAFGIFAQSAGGKNTGGEVEITLNGIVSAEGEGSHGLYAHSSGELGGKAIKITVKGGTVLGGTGFVRMSVAGDQPDSSDELPEMSKPVEVEASGVRMEGGTAEDKAANVLTNFGIITTHEGIDGMAVSATSGNDTVTNLGIIAGSVKLGTGNNTFNNQPNAVFETGGTVDLGSGSLTNSGTVSPASQGNIGITDLTGAISQTKTGRYLVDIDYRSHDTDRMIVSGAAELSGEVYLNRLNTADAREENYTTRILLAEGGITPDELTLGPSVALLDERLLYPNANELVLSTTVDFSPDGPGGKVLNSNQRAIGRYIADIQRAGGSERFAPVVAELFTKSDFDSLADAYTGLAPGASLNTQVSTLYSNQAFLNALFSCRSREGEYRFIKEGECSWMNLSYNELEYDDSNIDVHFREDSVSLSGGAQKAISKRWHAGFGLSLMQVKQRPDNNPTNTGNLFQGGLVAKKQNGPNAFSAALSAGYGKYDADRFTNLPTPGTTAESDYTMKFVAAQVRLSHDFDKGDWYVRPMIDAGISYAHTGGFDESGAGATNLKVDSSDDTIVTVAPAIEVGVESKGVDEALLRSFVRVGVKHYFNNDFEVTSTLEGAPQGVTPFTTKRKLDKNVLDVTAGLDIVRNKGFNVRLSGNAQTSERVKNYGGMLKISVPFK